MRHRNWINLVVVLALLASGAGILSASRPLVWTVEAQGPTILYAKPDASGSGTCDTWGDACTLQTALSEADAGDEIWVAGGIHTPGTVPTDTFQLLSGVEIYGGFAATETVRSQRDWAAHLTILSGDIDGNDTTDPLGVITDTAHISGSNSYHVVSGSGITETTVLDGFTVTGGNASSTGPNDVGGGMFNDGDSSPTLNHVTFSGNNAAVGGGMFNRDGSNPTLANVTFSGNNAVEDGGGMYNASGSNPALVNVAFSGNNAAVGGGGMLNAYGSSPSLVNVTFSGNNAGASGGGMLNAYGSSPSLVNVTFSGNNAGADGGGMFNVESCNPALTNCILWGNDATGSGDQIHSFTSTPIIAYSNVQDSGGSGSWDPSLGTDGGGNIDANPLFVDPVSATQAPTTAGDYRLLPASPAVDAGNSLSVTVTTDLDGNPRIAGAAVDMGPYERQPATLYVDLDAAGAGTGLSWTDAFTEVQSALAIAYPGDQVWVAEGIYYPDYSPDLDLHTSWVTSTFALPPGVALYGGFAATETVRSQRNWTAHPTLLSGDIGIPDEPVDNSYHVVASNGVAETAVLDGFTVTRGNANGDLSGPWVHRCGGGILNDAGSPTLAHIILSDNSAASDGGGMYNANGSHPTLTDVIFDGNTADYGGGMLNIGSSPALTGTQFISNTANLYGGGMYNRDGSSPTLVDVIFGGNTADYGGGMHNLNGSDPTLTETQFISNTADYGGGMHNDGSSPTLTGTQFISNTAYFYGGGMHNFSSSPSLVNVTFGGNQADWGGGIYNGSSSALTMEGCTVGPGNNVNWAGGGIANSGHLTITRSTVTGNSGTGIQGGAGIYVYSGGILWLADSTVSDNATNVNGGGLLVEEGSVTLTHCTVTSNTADLDGNGTGGGGGIYQTGTGSVQVQNSIIAGNGLGEGSTASGPDLRGAFTSLGYNLIGNTDGSTGFGATGDLTGSGSSPVDPLLADLALNPPGSTATHALLAGSPALDHIPYGANGCGSENTTDQRGVDRPTPPGGACDVGAYEVSPYRIYLPVVVRNYP